VFLSVWSKLSVNNIEVSIFATNKIWRERLDYIAYYPFELIGVNRVTAHVKADNNKGITIVKEIGFKYEGTMREALDGKDVHIFGLLKRDYYGN